MNVRPRSHRLVAFSGKNNALTIGHAFLDKDLLPLFLFDSLLAFAFFTSIKLPEPNSFTIIEAYSPILLP